MIAPKYHPLKAILVAIGNAIPLVVLPVFMLRSLPDLLPVDLPLDLTGLENTIIQFGVLAAGLAGLTAFFSKGLFPRAASGVARQGSRVAYLYFVLSGGILSLDFSLFDAGEVAFALNFGRLLYILYAAILLLGLYFVAEYFSYRTVFQEGEYAPAY